jgi:two-component system sensor histidine kinase GlrK
MENPQKVILERDKVISDIEFSIRKIADLSDKARNEKLQLSEQISNQIVKAIAVTETAAIILIILISFLITRSINRPIRLLREKTKMTAGGEFGQPLEITSPPEISELAASFNSMCARLKELDQMKIDFISHLSHELRTPLTAIKEASSMLMEGIFSQFPEKQQELFDIVNGECERLIKTVSRTLDLSRMEAGMAQFQFESADLNPIIERIGAKLSPIAQRKMIDLKLNIPEGIPILKIDEEKIGQVIENLLGNALNYTPEGGEIFISLCRNWEKNTVEVSVSDTGCGIPREHLKEIFEKFKRVDDRKGSVRGTGLGLAIAKHIINAHGGSIWAESEAGKGSTFIFSLPLQSVSS